jgi:hypothetical protein
MTDERTLGPTGLVSRAINSVISRVRRMQRSTALLVAVAYAPVMLSQPGTTPADTKLYLFLSPSRLIADAPYSWDTRQFGGWVPHQAVAYLWPSGPWFWSFERIGLPDWIAHRLWLGTLLFAAALGVRWCVRQLGFEAGATVGALVYMCSPYVLPYISRTSVMLLPWAGLGWMVGLAYRSARRGGWRDPAMFGLVVVTVGGVNATASAMVAAAPLLMLIEVGVSRLVSWRAVAAAASRIGAISVGVSLWWMAMLSVQGGFGADVLAFSETLQATSATATAQEVLRGGGYWLSYVIDPAGPTTSAAIRYQTSPWLLLAGFVLVLGLLSALVVLRWRWARLAAMCVAAGTVLAVGVHPIDGPSPAAAQLADDSRSTLALMFRSSTRAVPVLVFGLSLCAAALVSAAVRHARSRAAEPTTRRSAHAVRLLIGGLVAAQASPWWTFDLIDANLERGEPPAAWYDAAAHLNGASETGRVWQLPGVESQVFRWGYTVDPPLPAFTDRQTISRDWLPLGSTALMDLLYAADDRFQNGTMSAAAVAPIARFLGVDTIWLAGDADPTRFDSASPLEVGSLLDAAPGVTATNNFDDVIVLYDVEGAESMTPPTATRSDPIVVAAGSPVLVVGTGDGVVDAAAAGLLDGTEAIVYGVHWTATDDSFGAPNAVIITDSNRNRARQWRGSQHVWGFTESATGDADLLVADPQDARLTIGEADADDSGVAETASSMTTAELDGDVSITATSYGSNLRYYPQARPNRAIDGDPSTAWLVGVGDGPQIGESIQIGQAPGPLQLLQPADRGVVTSIEVRVGDRVTRIALDERSLVAPGQPVDIPGVSGDTTTPITITIVGVDQASDLDAGVGFAELGPWSFDEVVHVNHPPSSAGVSDAPLAVVVTRLRDPDAPDGLGDTELALHRFITLPSPPAEGTVEQFDAWITLRFGASFADVSGMEPGCVSGVLSAGSNGGGGGGGDSKSTEALIDVPVMIAQVDIEALTDGSSATVRPCAPLSIGGGTILLQGAAVDAPFVVDQVVLTRNWATAEAAPTAAHPAPAAQLRSDDPDERATVIGVDRTRTSRTIDVVGCADGCVVALGEGASTGWSAKSNGATLDATTVRAGQGWQLPPGPDRRRIEVTWTPQRRIWVALMLSGIAALACLVVVARRRSQQPTATSTSAPVHVSLPFSPHHAEAASRKVPIASAATAVLCALATAALVGPVAGLIVAAAIAVSATLRRTSLVTAIGWLVLAASLAASTRIALVYRPPAGFSWPSAFERYHRACLIGLALLVSGVVGRRAAALDPDTAATGSAESVNAKLWTA